jgi:hypothetical protein
VGVSAKKVLFTAVVGAPLAALAYAKWVRPWHLRWGLSAKERALALPGDEFVLNPKMEASHAIEIDASPQQIWPWLVQMGQGRGGFYSYTWLENLIGCAMRNADRVVPEWQNLRVGDPVWLHPGAAPMEVRTLERNRALVFYGGADAFRDFGDRFVRHSDPEFASSWAFVLRPLDDGRTRLVVRNRSTYGESLQQELAVRCLLEPAHFFMERKLLKTLKNLVERENENWLPDPEDDETATMFL